jgi:hypothetical protein
MPFGLLGQSCRTVQNACMCYALQGLYRSYAILTTYAEIISDFSAKLTAHCHPIRLNLHRKVRVD